MGEIEAGLCRCSVLVGSAAVCVVDGVAVALVLPPAGVADLMSDDELDGSEGGEQPKQLLLLAALRLFCRATLSQGEHSLPSRACLLHSTQR